MKEHRIPTAVGLVMIVALVAVVAVTTSAAQKVTSLISQATGAETPATIGIANITDTSFSVYWSSDTETASTVYYGKTTSLEIGAAVDDRDLASPNGKHFTHLIRVANLDPQTKYYYKVGNQTNITQTLSTASVTNPIFGKILDSTGVAAPDVLALWEASGFDKIVALSKNDGSFVLPIPKTADGLETITLDGGGTLGVASITCKSGLDRPLPTVKLGDTIDCSAPAAQTSASQSAVFRPPSNQGVQINISNGQQVNSPLPTISGKAGPNQIVKIEVHSDTPYSASVQASPDGSWSWTPPANLSVGQHTVTITVVNPDGTTQTVQRTFIVSSGSLILPITSGTPSAQATPPAAPIIPTPPPATPAATTPPQTGAVENTFLILTLGIISVILGVCFSFAKTNPLL